MPGLSWIRRSVTVHGGPRYPAGAPPGVPTQVRTRIEGGRLLRSTDAAMEKQAAPTRGGSGSGPRCRGLASAFTSPGPRAVISVSSPGRCAVPGGSDRHLSPVGLSKARTEANPCGRPWQPAAIPPLSGTRNAVAGACSRGLAARYMKEHAERHKRSASADARNLRKHVLPTWGSRDFTTIRRGDVIELVEGLVAAGKPTLANRVQALVSKVFSFAIDAELRDDNPCHRMQRRGVETSGSACSPMRASAFLEWHC